MSKFGQNHTKAAKLSAEQVRQIRELYANSSASQGQLARDFGISIGQIGRIIRGEAWQQVPATAATREQLALSAQRMLELQEAERKLSAEERMIRDIAEEQARHPDKMIQELGGEEREATAAELAAFELGAALPPGVRLPKGSPD